MIDLFILRAASGSAAARPWRDLTPTGGPRRSRSEVREVRPHTEHAAGSCSRLSGAAAHLPRDERGQLNHEGEAAENRSYRVKAAPLTKKLLRVERLHLAPRR
jgi:hypothetical protein